MNKFNFYLALVFLFFVTLAHSQTFTMSGYITDAKSKETLIGVQIANLKQNVGTNSNGFGFYTLTMKKDSVQLIVRLLGYAPKVLNVYLDRNITYPIELQEIGKELGVVEVSAAKQNAKVSKDTRVSSIDIPVEQVKELPALFGEKDVFKVIQLLPGVQKGSEGNSGLYVRGGGPDQNLIILDDANVYNAFHLFGFFSVFNGDALKSIELIKGGFPARYGGRLSSVLDMRLKDGDKQKTHGEGGIGIISSRLTLEGPLLKNKSSFLFSARRTYIDLLIQPFLPSDSKGGYYFYDMNAKLNYTLSDKDRLFLSGYFGKDIFYAKFIESSTSSTNASIAWGNKTSTLRWNHIFGPKVFSNLSAIYSLYNFDVTATQKDGSDQFTLKLLSGIADGTLKYDFEIIPNPRHHVRTGFLTTYHVFTPQAVTMKDANFNLTNVKKFYALESALYIEDDYEMNTKIKMNGGLRISNYKIGNANFVKPEPRFNFRYLIHEDFSFKLGYSIMNQYLHLLSNTGAGLPTDLWVPSTERVKPQTSQQIAGGFFKDIEYRKEDYAVSLEGYYKLSKNVIAYKEGASFIDVLNDPFSSNTGNQKTWENQVTSGNATSYGAELFIQKKAGKFTGWIGYTLSWTNLQFDSLNNGNKFWARYDRRHDLSVVGIYKFNSHITASAVWVYGTGNAITLPVGTQIAIPQQELYGYKYYGRSILSSYTIDQFGGRNEFRMAPYHRLDLSVQFHKKLKYWEQTWEVSVYNLYNRANPYFYYVGESKKDPSKTVLKQVSIFPVLPSLTYSFKF
ncbi:MAG: TonB-dependent receptor plug domain-containing protein [Bacteroidetes bacterium]|nr:TonB-dependent receptor plug domain-containing protein [Bacteroidota bacterium]